MQKYGFDDARPILERASARETAARVALGAVARPSSARRSASRSSATSSPSARSRPRRVLPGSRQARHRREPGPLRRPGDQRARWSPRSTTSKDGDTLGGVVEVVVYGLPPGLGSHVHWDRRLDSRLAAALMGIQAIKGVEIGDGFGTARRRGTQAHDEIDQHGEGA